MFKKLNLRQKLFLYLSIIFIGFTILVLIFQYEREKNFRKKQLENTLKNITELTHKYIDKNSLQESNNYQIIDSLNAIIPVKRITVIDKKGIVLYDSEVINFKEMENHLQRPEIQKAISADFGTNIRNSKTTGHSYYYYAIYFSDYYVRTAALYDITVKDFLKINKFFIIYIISLFILTLLILFFFTKNLGKTITKLKNLNIANDKILVEKNKLYSHLQALNQGIAFYSADKKKILFNNHFIQFLNLISEKSNITAENIFEVKEFETITQFIDQQLNTNNIITDNLPNIEYDIFKNGKYFNIKSFFFQDKSFEVVITDTTKLEKRRLIKQQMTSNIAHELKTPVATIMGYIETLQNNIVTPKKQEYFIEKAFRQAKRLSLLIEDISVLNKIEEANKQFRFEQININEIVEEVKDNLKLKLEEKKIKVNIQFHKSIIIIGNKSLLFSVFYNLFDNVIKYGGENIKININNYLEDINYYYFSFSNTGNNIKKEHLARIFERFYRIDKGRSRKTGGTGLGLAIVKNAVQLHKGQITARNYKTSGVEFLFTLGITNKK